MPDKASYLPLLREQLIKHREELGLTQRQLASRLQWHPSYIAKFESGVRGLSVEDFVLYARALDQDPLKILAKFIKAADL